MEIVYLDPGKILPSPAFTGVMTVQFTRVHLTYAVGGYMDQSLDRTAPMVDALLEEKFGRFKSFVETTAKK